MAEETYFSAGKLAAHCGVSPRQLARFVRDRHQRPTQQWLNELRQREAFELISQGCMIKEIYARFGYRHASDFSRAFKRFHGVTPAKILTPDSAPCREKLGRVPLC